MREPASQRDRDLFDEIFADPSRAADALAATLTVAGESIRVDTDKAFRSFTQDDGAAVALEAYPAIPLPAVYTRKRVFVDLDVEGVPFRDYTGWAMSVGSSAGEGGSLGGSTSGYWQEGEDAVRFGKMEGTSYAGVEPSRAAYDMLRLLPYARINLPAVREPLFTKIDSERYPPQAAIGEGLADIEEEAGLIVRDDGRGWARGYLRPSLAAPVAPVARWELGVHLTEFKADIENEARYRDVAVIRRNQDGTWRDLVTPRPEVRYPPGVEPPPVGVTYYEVISDEGPLAGASAMTRAHNRARLLSLGEWQVSFETAFLDPRVEDFDIVEVLVRDYRTDEVAMRFRVLITSHEHHYGTPTATYKGKAAILPERSLPITSVTQGVIPLPLWGLAGDELYFNEPLSWVTVSGDELVFDSNNGGAMTLVGDELVVEE